MSDIKTMEYLLKNCVHWLNVLEQRAEDYAANQFHLPTELLLGIEDTKIAISNLTRRLSEQADEYKNPPETTPDSVSTQDLQHKNPLIRFRAAEDLGSSGSIGAVEPLIAALKDKDSYVQIGVIEALGRLGDVRAVGAITQKLFEESEGVCTAAVHALGKFCDPSVIEPLCKILAIAQPDVRVAIVNTLPIFGTLATDCLVQALTSDNENVRIGALRALSELGGAEKTDHIIPLLQDVNSSVRGWAAKILGEKGDESVLVELTRLLEDNEEAWPEVSVKYVASYSIKQLKARLP